MSEGSIRIPSSLMPIGVALLSCAAVWGASEARAEATAQEVEKLEIAVKKQAEKLVQQGELSAVNQAQIQSLVGALSTQSQALEGTQESINDLISLMLKQQQ